MARRLSLISRWFLLVNLQIICIIGLSVGSEDADLKISSSKLKDHLSTFDQTPLSSHQADQESKKDVMEESADLPVEVPEKDFETSVKDDILEGFKASHSLEDSESGSSQEVAKDNAKEEELSKDVSETVETSNVVSEEMMPSSGADKTENMVDLDIADERKIISIPEVQQQVGGEHGNRLEAESPIESSKNLDEIPQQESDKPIGELLPDSSEQDKTKAEDQPVEDGSNFSNIPAQEENSQITSDGTKKDVEVEKLTEHERVNDDKEQEPDKSTGELLLDSSEQGKTKAEDQPVEDGSNFSDIPAQEENSQITSDGTKKDVEVEKVSENERMSEDEESTGYCEKMAVDEEHVAKDEDDVKILEDEVVKANDHIDEEVEKFFQNPAPQSAKRGWGFFTIKPYITLLKTVAKKSDPFVTGIIFMLPPSLQSIFLKAPFSMYPTHAFLIFSLSCLSLFVISFSKIMKGNRQHSKSRELKELLFETKGALLLSQVERDESERKLQDLKAKLKQKDDDLENGTVEMNRNLKALIKECDALKEEVSRRVSSSKEMKGETKKVESDVQKQSLAMKDIQESIATAKNHIQQLQDKRDQLQSTIDDSELNSIRLEEKIQCLSEDVETKQESYDQVRAEVDLKEKESGELQTAVDLLTKDCSKKSDDVETKEKENKILREAIMQLKMMKHLQDDDDEGGDDDDDDDDGGEKKKEKLEEKIKHLIYIAQMRSRMDEMEDEKESLKKSLSGAAKRRMDLNDELKRMTEEMEKVEQLREDVERHATASTMKIDVLSDYYKQREKEYNKMLQEKEAKEKAMNSQKKSANERYKEVDKMVADYKNRVEVLNQELERIGIHYEKQMALQENRLQENLVFVKQTERDYNMKIKEAEIMRQKLLQYRERINLLESMMAVHKSTETLNTSQTKEDTRPTSRNLLLRENMPSPPNFMPPSRSPHPSAVGPIPPQFLPPPPFLLRHPFVPPRLPTRSREDSPTLQRLRDLPSEDSVDERDRYSLARTRSPPRFGPSPASRNKSSPADLKDKYAPPLMNNRPLDSFYMEKGDGSYRTSNDK